MVQEHDGGMKMENVIYVVSRGCTICGTCMPECPVKAITLTKGGAVIDPKKCKGCGVCYDNCASEAIERREVKKCELESRQNH
ncbi:MAG: 4Fe-4S dicluster domain-containing protein [Planctomycetota bacterium]